MSLRLSVALPIAAFWLLSCSRASVPERSVTDGVTVRSQCPDLSGNYMIQGEDEQVHISVKQERCDRINIVRNSGYPGTITSEAHVLKLDGKVQEDSPWMGSTDRYKTSAKFDGSVLQLQARTPRGTTLTMIYSLTPDRHLLEDVLIDGRRHGGPLAARRQNAGVISGRVLDTAGRPVAGVSVTALPARYYSIPNNQPAGPLRIQGTAPADSVSPVPKTTKTNARGEYQIYYWAPAEYYICASPAPAVTCLESSLGDTFFPATVDRAKAQPVHVRGGQEVKELNVVMDMRRRYTASISGRILNPDAAKAGSRLRFVLMPRKLAEPILLSGAQEFQNAANSPSAGQFEIRNVPPGSYELLVTDQPVGVGHAVAAVGRTPVTVVEKNIEGVNVTLRRAIQPKGRVLAADGRPLPLQSVEFLLWTDIHPLLSKAPFVGKVDPSGAIVLTAPFSGTRLSGDPYPFFEGLYELRAIKLPPGAYILDVRQGGKSVYEGARIGGFPIQFASDSAPVEVIVGTGGATIEGEVQGAQNKRAAHATVTLVPEGTRRANANAYASTITDDRGHFSLTGIAPGKYKVFGWETIPEFAYLNPAYLAPQEEEGVAITVAAAPR
ncbi:MAG TPA: carboxypeptidase-like regulatory domain-containing protein, partial [Terriglobia bacterium]|nr:carboxypeptidase-like regulatory domain-containing protein [Terriglobia bacterium]